MPKVNLTLHHESIARLESFINNLETPSDMEIYDLYIETDLACPACDGDIVGEINDNGKWFYHCEYCNEVINVEDYT